MKVGIQILNSQPEGCLALPNENRALELKLNDSLYKSYEFDFSFPASNPPSRVFQELYAPEAQTHTIIAYGEKGTGKSQLLGTLFQS